MRRFILASLLAYAFGGIVGASASAQLLTTHGGLGLLGRGGGGGAPSLTGIHCQSLNPIQTSSASCTLSGTPTSGNALVVIAYWCNSSTCNSNTSGTVIPSVATDAPQTCTNISSTAASFSTVGASQIFAVCSNLVVGGSNVVTFTCASNCWYPALIAEEVQGAATTSPAEVGNGGNGTGAAPSLATSGATSQSNELIIGFAVDFSQVMSAGSCCTYIATGGGGNNAILEYQGAATAGTYTNNWASAASDAYVASIMAIKHP